MRLGTEEDPRLFSSPYRVRVGSCKTAEECIELPRRNTRFPASCGRLDSLLKLVNVAAVERRDVDPRRPGIGLNVALDLALQIAAALFIGQIPLVVGDDHCPPRILDHREDAKVLIADRLRRVDDDHAHLGTLDGGLGAQ